MRWIGKFPAPSVFEKEDLHAKSDEKTIGNRSNRGRGELRRTNPFPRLRALTKPAAAPKAMTWKTGSKRKPRSPAEPKEPQPKISTKPKARKTFPGFSRSQNRITRSTSARP